ncbi:MAG: CHAT domain-containing protein [bacterium]|nr:CHAT domain-containing protein [bacterium]
MRGWIGGVTNGARLAHVASADGFVPLLVAFVAPLIVASAQTTQATGETTTPVGTSELGDEARRRSDLTRFLELLEQVRGGDDDAIDELRRLANHVCVAWRRCDTRSIAAFYAGLSADERRAGSQAEEEFRSLRREVAAASRTTELWPRESSRLTRELRAFVARTEDRADFTPAARAYALLARIEKEKALAWRTLSPGQETEREALLERAHADAEISIAAFERAGMRTPQLEPLWVLGRVERARGRFDRAREHYAKCDTLADAVGRGEYRERALLGLIEIAKDTGDVARLDEHVAELATIVSVDTHWPLAREHALRLLHMDHPDEALEFALDHPPVDDEDMAQWHGLLAACFLRSGDALSAAQEVERIGADQGELTILARASYDLDAGELGPVSAALESARRESWSYQGRTQAHWLLGEAALKRGDAVEAREHLERTLAMAATWRSRQLEAGGSVVGEWIGVHAVTLLAEACVDLDDPLEAARVIEAHQAQRLRATASELTSKQLVLRARAYAGGFVTWSVGADSSVVAHVRNDGNAAAARIEVGRRALERAVRRLREATLENDSARASRIASELSTVLFPPQIATRLAALEPGARTLLLLHGPLEEVPTSLLVLDGKPLDDRLTALVLPGSIDAATVAAPADWRATRWTLAGSPLDAGGQALLPHAADELEALAALHPDARRVSGASFERDALTDALRGTGALHVATHVVPWSPCTSTTLSAEGLLLADGDVLCAEEILALQPRLNLVVLAACESGGGRFVDAEGLHGVGRAFLEAGTRNVVVSLWPVADEAARHFSLAFHGALSNGLAPSVAVREARTSMRASGLPSADWAAFRLIGRD